MNNEIEGVYLSKVTIKDFNCFQGEHQISFTRPDGRYQQWNVILGNNNTGKTTILRLLSGLSATILQDNSEEKGIAPCVLMPFQHMWDLTSVINQFEIKSVIQKKENSSFENLTKGWAYYKSQETNNVIVSGLFPDDQNFLYFKKLKFYGYGIARKMSETNITDSSYLDTISGLFSDNYELTNAEEWLLQLDYAAKNGVSNASAVLERLKAILSSGLLPDVKSIELKSELDSKTNSVRNYAIFETDYGKVRLKGLGYGYQATMAWVVDLAKKLFERYPNLDNPLTGAAIVLVDEIDLHLHPDWQRKIISYLSGIFPNTQFIVTAHSPLIVQSAENVNLIILEKGADNYTHIRQEFGTFKGWTVEEILQDLMGLGDKTLSDTYLQLLSQFEEGLDSDDYGKARTAYEELLPLLHPNSSQRKLLKLQLGAIAPASV
ncbi:AAA family ATPase [Runella sp. MFBS21]|uniref:AAA family ATPase n=1 Tax=Runella sp. MFBS21 TaxID=3034018 RepID=UPI0023F931B3|nr:AAA family ATPase [Runella sp. MFBS21]MDF7816562.1 AAA family ATPase [Runella sp. MFBS21]